MHKENVPLRIKLCQVSARLIIKNINVTQSYHLAFGLVFSILALLKSYHLGSVEAFSQGHLLLSVLYEFSLENNNRLYVGQIEKQGLQRNFPTVYKTALNFD